MAGSFQKRNRTGTVRKTGYEATIPIGVANPIEMVEGLVRPLRSSISTAINGNQRSNPRVQRSSLRPVTLLAVSSLLVEIDL